MNPNDGSLRRFPTGSSYSGFYNKTLHCMEGFGRYVFPDNSEYNGYFRRGKFHGYGRIRMAAPYYFTLVGEFEDGALITLDEMIYADGLRLFHPVSSNGMNFDKWPYCTEKDRRFTREVVSGLEAVGPIANETKARIPRDVPPGTYDCEEGIYAPRTGFMSKIPIPFYKHRFVTCDPEKEWILRNCRKGRNPEEPLSEPDKYYGRRIIDTNVGVMSSLGFSVPACYCTFDRGKNVGIKGSCFNIAHESTDPDASKYESDMEMAPPSTSSASEVSFCDEPLRLNMYERCADEVYSLHFDELASSDD